MPAAPGAAMADVTPGTTSYATPAARTASHPPPPLLAAPPPPVRRSPPAPPHPADAAPGPRHAAPPHQLDRVGIDDAIPQPGADASVGDPPRQLGPQLAQQLEQRRVFRSDQPPDPLAQPHRERGALPCGRNDDRHVALAVDR